MAGGRAGRRKLSPYINSSEIQLDNCKYFEGLGARMEEKDCTKIEGRLYGVGDGGGDGHDFPVPALGWVTAASARPGWRDQSPSHDLGSQQAGHASPASIRLTSICHSTSTSTSTILWGAFTGESSNVIFSRERAYLPWHCVVHS